MTGIGKIAPRYDVIIIGAEHNGLIAACYLANAKFSVQMLEKNAEIGLVLPS